MESMPVIVRWAGADSCVDELWLLSCGWDNV